MLRLENVGFEYALGRRRLLVLDNIHHTFCQGSFTSIQGPSGSGKTTLLNMLGLLDKPSRGRYLIGQEDAGVMNDLRKSNLRAETFGFLFQNFRLIPTRTVLDNVILSLDIFGLKGRVEQRGQAMRALERVGLLERAHHLPAELSGGEAQRVALARALAKTPKVLLADEPTGNLDASNRNRILDLMSEFHGAGGTVIMVTHDDIAAQRAEFVLQLQAKTIIKRDTLQCPTNFSCS